MLYQWFQRCFWFMSLEEAGYFNNFKKRYSCCCLALNNKFIFWGRDIQNIISKNFPQISMKELLSRSNKTLWQMEIMNLTILTVLTSSISSGMSTNLKNALPRQAHHNNLMKPETLSRSIVPVTNSSWMRLDIPLISSNSTSETWIDSSAMCSTDWKSQKYKRSEHFQVQSYSYF